LKDFYRKGYASTDYWAFYRPLDISLFIVTSEFTLRNLKGG